jgi:hypothetical protein
MYVLTDLTVLQYKARVEISGYKVQISLKLIARPALFEIMNNYRLIYQILFPFLPI